LEFSLVLTTSVEERQGACERTKTTARSVLESAETRLVEINRFRAENQPLELCGERYRRTAYKLGVWNADTIADWRKVEGEGEARLDFVDMFCGCGGISVGFLALNRLMPIYRLAGALDIDENACETFTRNLGVRPHQLDARKLLEQDSELNLFLESCSIDKPWVLVGCPPCQGFSSHHKKNWHQDDTRNGLIEVFAEIAAQMLPDFILMENVPELFSHKYWPHFEAFRSILERAGYCVSAGIVNMARFGVPQERHRAIVLAGRFSSKIPAGFIAEDEFVTVRDAISHISAISPGSQNPNDPMLVTAHHKASTLETIRQIPKNGGSRPKGVGPKCLDRVRGFYDVYGRLSWDRPSITITAYARNPASGRFIHPEQDRGLSVREVAILQSFPNSYMFDGPFDSKFSQIGNAVPPRFASFISSYIIGELASASASSFSNQENEVSKPITNSYSSKIATSKMSRGSNCDIRPTAVDAFCGAGGLSLGLRNAGFVILKSYDSNEAAVETYRNNLGDQVMLADANQISISDLLGNKQQSDLVLFAGGPPCQGCSVQRRGDDSDSRNSLVGLFFRQAMQARPQFILLENVLGLVGNRGVESVKEISRLCAEFGYYCHTKMLNAADFGVPQVRRRMFIVAERIHNGELYFEFPPPILTLDNWKTVWDAISDLPPTSLDGAEYNGIPNHRSDRITERNRVRFSFVQPGGGREQIPAELRLPCHQVSVEAAGHRYVYGRLDWQRPAGVITARFDSLTRGRFGHPEDDRTISLREGARLQGFPDYFVFSGTKTEVAAQVGNAVPPPLAEALGRAIIDAWNRRRAGELPRRMSGE